MNYTNITEVCNIQLGKTPKRSESKYWGQGYSWVSIADMNSKFIANSKEEINDLAVKENNMKIVPENTLIMSFKLSIGKVGITKKELYTNEAIAAFIIKDHNLLLTEYLYYVLKSYNYDHLMDSSARGKTLNKQKLEQIEIPLISIKEQEQIIHVLNKAENLLRFRQQQIEALSTLKHSVFLETFGDPNTNPNSYLKKPLKEISQVITGNTPPRKDKDNYVNHIEWIKSNNISENKIYLTQAREYLSEKGASIGRVVPENSILVTCIAGSRSSIGRAAIANRGVAFNQQINAIVPYEDIDTPFLFTQIEILKPYIQSFSTNSMKGMISKTNFEKIEVIVPTLEEQLNFHHKFNQIISIEEKLENSLKNMEEVYESVLYKAFNGELFKEDLKV